MNAKKFMGCLSIVNGNHSLASFLELIGFIEKIGLFLGVYTA